MGRLQRWLWRAAAVTSMTSIGAAFPAAAAEVAIEVHRHDESVVIEASALVTATADLTWMVLTDYPRYAEFIPGVRECRIVRRDGASVTVEQSTHVFLGPLAIPVNVVYEIAETAPRDLWSSTDFAQLGTLHSYYAVRPQGARSRLTYVGRLVARPGALPALEQAVLTDTVTRQFQALAAEIERAAGLDERLSRRRRRVSPASRLRSDRRIHDRPRIGKSDRLLRGGRHR
jgi:hypothetical protein